VSTCGKVTSAKN